MNEEPKDKLRSRFNSLISGAEKKPVEEKSSILSRLPRKVDVPPPAARNPENAVPQKSLGASEKGPFFGLFSWKSRINRLRHPDQKVSFAVLPENKPPPTPPKPAPAKRKIRYNFGPPFWTISGIISLVVNVILIALLLGLLINMRQLQVQNVLGLGSSLLGGLYTNFEKMDRAHIRTTIPVVTEIPVKFDLQLNQQTSVVLSQDVTIDGVLVTVQTGGLNISRARSTIVLPQGTSLPVFLNLVVPVDTMVPVTLNVEVDIPMNQTELHEPFVGLQEVVKPFYCLVSPSALNLDGQMVCK